MKQGFTLVEMAIVMVIFGLVAAGITVGSDLIRASRVRSILSQKEEYRVAMIHFKDTYFGIPGDISNAEALWGTASGGCPEGTGSGTQTCNGNGNGFIDTDTNEMYRAWQQLVNGQFIQGHFTGIKNHATGYYYCTPNINCPVTELDNTTFGIRYPNMDAGSAAWFTSKYGHTLEFGGSTYWPTSATDGALTAKEAWSVDTKIDDGNPASGNVMGMKNAYWGGNCVTTDDPATAIWANADIRTCGLIFKTGF